jgi:hypothetical protein
MAKKKRGEGSYNLYSITGTVEFTLVSSDPRKPSEIESQEELEKYWYDQFFEFIFGGFFRKGYGESLVVKISPAKHVGTLSGEEE